MFHRLARFSNHFRATNTIETKLQKAYATFNANKHLISPSKTKNIKNITLSELDIETGNDHISDFAYTEPFELLTEECVNTIRSEITSNSIKQNCYYSSSLTPLTIRNPNTYSSFLADLHSSPEISEIFYNITGIEISEHPYIVERSMCNIQSDMQNIQLQNSNSNTLFDWHYDHNDFVLIVILNNMPSNPIGGGTIIKYGNNLQYEKEIIAPAAGYAYFVQGRRVLHAGNKSQNYKRVAMIQTYSYLDKYIRGIDELNLKLSSNYTDHNVLINEYLKYRLNELMNKANKYTECEQISLEFGQIMNDLQDMEKELKYSIDSIKFLKEFDNNKRPLSLQPNQIDMSFAEDW
eukprot:992445_1